MTKTRYAFPDGPGPHVCRCSCHTTGAKHVVACCQPCKECGRSIKTEFIEEHRRRHEIVDH